MANDEIEEKDLRLVNSVELVLSEANREDVMSSISDCITAWGTSTHKGKRINMNFQGSCEEVAYNLHKKGKGKGKFTKVAKKKLTKKALNDFEHKRIRQAWKQDRSKVAQLVLDGAKIGKNPEEIVGFTDHWAATYKVSPDLPNIPDGVQHKEYDIWKFVSDDECKRQLATMQNKSAKGPDGITVQFMKNHTHELHLLVNCFIIMGAVPACLKQSRTVFIPKKDGASRPNEYRPISVSSVVLRLFNNILAKRILTCAPLDDRQRGFRPVDGVCENIMMAEGLIDLAQRQKRSLYLANLDMTNAYGSVNHEALLQCLKENGANAALLNYIRDLYTNFMTTLLVGKTEHELTVERGVVQGDPLSCILFNIVMERVIRAIPEDVGFQITKDESLVVNGMAFADDMTAIASTAEGLQLALTRLQEAAAPLGLFFNPQKCQYLALESIRGKKIKVNDKLRITLQGQFLRGTSESEVWRYLGAWFNPKGLADSVFKLHEWLDRLKKQKSLFPQEKLYILRFHLIPRLIFRLSMERVSAGNMEKCDRIIRQFLVGKHGILHLHGKTPLAFFYADIKDGGLGLIRFRYTIPHLVHTRFGRLQESTNPLIKSLAHQPANVMRLSKVERIFAKHEDLVGSSKTRVHAIHRQILHHERWDGRGLRYASEVPYAHQWVLSGSIKSMKGNEFCAAMALRSNTLMCKSRVGRGQENYSRLCKHGCKEEETIEHRIQCCPRTYGDRIKRHNRVALMICQRLRRLGYEVHSEKRFDLDDGTRRFPDIVAVKDGRVFILDPTIVGDYENPDARYDLKVEKYDVEEIRREIDRLFPDHQLFVGGVAITFRGIVSKKSADILLEAGLSKADIRQLAITTIKGSIICYEKFKLNVNQHVLSKLIERVFSKYRTDPGQPLATTRG